MKHNHTNELIHESSPYLLQHAHNPVNWHSYTPSSLNLAVTQNKPIIISVGYAACHWCHVMEKESFENDDVAKIMNKHFINIKVDREERPDVDQFYMNAIQIMTGTGGWPMNVVTLPDGRPFWGGTYFRKEQWMYSLKEIVHLYQNNPEKIEEYANNLAQGLKTISIVPLNKESSSFSEEKMAHYIRHWSSFFDTEYGGLKRAPKFMMPSTIQFLLEYTGITNNTQINPYTQNTLTKMAYGGIYDHIGGGFSRYAVDAKWHIPHFEKMLYDNAQLVSVYCIGWQKFKDPVYKNVVKETLHFVEHELMSINFGFFSSLDADSVNHNGQLEEGAFYVWTKKELQNILQSDFDIFSSYYNINTFGRWKDDCYVLIRDKTNHDVCKTHSISEEQLLNKIQSCKEKLYLERSKRNKPRLDDKIITSWNALMLKGYTDAYKTFQEPHYLDIALKNAQFIMNNLMAENGSLWHTYQKNGNSINGFLEDYAFTIEAFINLYEVTTHEQWLYTAKMLTDYCLDNFFDELSKMFFFTAINDPFIITRTMEKSDSVIPASNSVMAHNLFRLGHFFCNQSYLNTSRQMLNNIVPDFEDYTYNHTNWLRLMLYFTKNFYEIAITGNNSMEMLHELYQNFIPNKIVAASNLHNSKIPILKNRIKEEETLIYVCENNTCNIPVKSIKEAIKQILNN